MSRARFLEEAEAEFLKEVQYYAEVQAGGAGRFRAAIEEATARALAFPTAALSYLARTRRVFVKGYQFFLVCRSEEAGEVAVSCGKWPNIALPSISRRRFCANALT